MVAAFRAQGALPLGGIVRLARDRARAWRNMTIAHTMPVRMDKPKPTARIRLVLAVLVFLSLLTMVAVLPSFASELVVRLARGQGLDAALEGLTLGREIAIGRLAIGLPGGNEPFLVIERLRFRPTWATVLGTHPIVDEVEARAVSYRHDPALAEWVARRPTGDSAGWKGRIRRLDIEAWTAVAFAWSASGRIEAEGLGASGVDSATVTIATGDGIRAAITIDPESICVEAGGAVVPAMLRSVPGLERADSGWTLRAVASNLGVRDDSSSLPSARPRWFQELLDRGLRIEATVDGESAPLARIAVIADRKSGTIGVASGAADALGIHGAFSLQGETLVASVACSVRHAGASLAGRLELLSVPTRGFRILPGSRWEMEGGRLGGRAFPGGTIAFSGDYDSGFLLRSAGALGEWTASLDPAGGAARWSGTMVLRGLAPLDVLRWTGGAEGRVEGSVLQWNAKGRLEGTGRAGATPFQASLTLDAEGSNDRVRLSLDQFAVKDMVRPEALGLRWERAVVIGTPRSWRTEARVSGTVLLHGREVPLSFEIQGDDRGVALQPLAVGGLQFRVKAEFLRGRYGGSNFFLEQAPLSSLVALVPGPQRVLLGRSTLDGTLRADFRHTADRKLTGTLHLRVARFSDPVAGFEIEGLEAEIPIRQRFVNPSEVRFVTQAERWPDVPVNLTIRRLAREGVEVKALSGRAVFADYVFRFRDIGFDILGGRGRARFILDPFRSEQGRWRSALELTVERLPLRNIYEAFVGKGTIARGIEGSLGLEIETAWSDTECLAGRGRIASLGGGKVGRRVIQALVQMMPREKRPPAIALAFLGDYDFDSFTLALQRDAEIGDFRTSLSLLAEKETLLGELELEVPLLRLLQGLPAEVEHDIGLRRGR